MRRRCRAGRNAGSRNDSVAGLTLLVTHVNDLKLWLGLGLPALALSLCFLGNTERRATERSAWIRSLHRDSAKSPW